MSADPPGTPRGSGTAFSPDGFWWWDGARWRSALSPDGMWRWDGRAWVAVPRPPAGGGGGGAGALIAVAGFGGVLLLVLLLTLLVLYTMGSEITNVFSNVAAALSGP